MTSQGTQTEKGIKKAGVQDNRISWQKPTKSYVRPTLIPRSDLPVVVGAFVEPDLEMVSQWIFRPLMPGTVFWISASLVSAHFAIKSAQTTGQVHSLGIHNTKMSSHALTCVKFLAVSRAHLVGF